eukprot:TRINITY_DN3870_c0_g1_i1.p3 TRINITY_DN3870_c0_g1~~TRINITY_DN3870_c0_g1_i1.p3  ORF type:complete len:194 (+),score=60.86 TRINITY_DN3870_c0_g1_i1:64-645(+)
MCIRDSSIIDFSPMLSLMNFQTAGFGLFTVEIDEEQSRCFRNNELFATYDSFQKFVNGHPKCFVSTCAASSECDTGLFCNTQSKKCNNCVKNCDSCSDATVCKTCQTQYYLLNQGCEPCLSFITGCSSSCVQETNCINCKSTNKDCLACFQSCSICFNQESCNVCTQKTLWNCLLYTSPSPRDVEESRMPSSA